MGGDSKPRRFLRRSLPSRPQRVGDRAPPIEPVRRGSTTPGALEDLARDAGALFPSGFRGYLKILPPSFGPKVRDPSAQPNGLGSDRSRPPACAPTGRDNRFASTLRIITR